MDCRHTSTLKITGRSYPCPQAPPRPWCCRTPQPPWPEGVPLAPAVEERQHRRAPDGRTIYVFGIDNTSVSPFVRFAHNAPRWRRGLPQGVIGVRCDTYVTDVEGRRVYAVMTAWQIATTFTEVIDCEPRRHVISGERRRAAGGIEVRVGSSDARGEHVLRVIRATPEDVTQMQIESHTYSPAEIARLYPDLVPDDPLDTVEGCCNEA